MPLYMACARSTLLGLLTLIIATAPGRATVLANGSFESGPDPGAIMALPPGSAALPGWTVTRGGVRYAGTEWTAAQGTRSIALNGSDAGGIAQTFATLPRAQYAMRLYMAGDPGTLPDLKAMSVVAAGQRADFTKDISGMWAWDPGWDLRVFSFIAVAESTTLELFSTMPGTTGPTVDSVSVELTSVAEVGAPSPAGLALAPPSPNPSRGASVVEFSLPARLSARVSVFDLAGREVAVLADAEFAAGPHQAIWNARGGGGHAPPGLYLVSLKTPDATLTRHLFIIR